MAAWEGRYGARAVGRRGGARLAPARWRAAFAGGAAMVTQRGARRARVWVWVRGGGVWGRGRELVILP